MAKTKSSSCWFRKHFPCFHRETSDLSYIPASSSPQTNEEDALHEVENDINCVIIDNNNSIYKRKTVNDNKNKNSVRATRLPKAIKVRSNVAERYLKEELQNLQYDEDGNADEDKGGREKGSLI